MINIDRTQSLAEYTEPSRQLKYLVKQLSMILFSLFLIIYDVVRLRLHKHANIKKVHEKQHLFSQIQQCTSKTNVPYFLPLKHMLPNISIWINSTDALLSPKGKNQSSLTLHSPSDFYIHCFQVVVNSDSLNLLLSPAHFRGGDTEAPPTYPCQSLQSTLDDGPRGDKSLTGARLIIPQKCCFYNSWH